MSIDVEDRLFGTVERRLFRTTAVLLCLVVLASLVGLVAWVLAITAAVFHNLILPLAVAGILALVLYPVIDFLEARLRMSRLAATTLILAALSISLVGVLVLVVPAVAQEIVDFSAVAPDLVAGWRDYLIRRFPDLSKVVSGYVKDATLGNVLPNLEDTGQTIKASIGLLIGLSFVPLFLFFTLLSGDRIRSQAAELLSVFNPATQKKVLYFMDVFVEQVTAFFQGQLIIAVLMGTLFAMAFATIGLKLGILVGLVLGLLNVVPYLGTLVGLLLVLPLAWLQPGGGIRLLGFCLVVFAVVQLIESWVLTPKIMANRTGLHPALVVIAVIFWGTALGGILGMILAVPLTAFIVAIWSQVKSGLTRGMHSDQDAGVTIYQGPESELAVEEVHEGMDRS